MQQLKAHTPLFLGYSNFQLTLLVPVAAEARGKTALMVARRGHTLLGRAVFPAEAVVLLLVLAVKV
jgi:hypothetical protein